MFNREAVSGSEILERNGPWSQRLDQKQTGSMWVCFDLIKSFFRWRSLWHTCWQQLCFHTQRKTSFFSQLCSCSYCKGLVHCFRLADHKLTVSPWLGRTADTARYVGTLWGKPDEWRWHSALINWPRNPPGRNQAHITWSEPGIEVYRRQTFRC